MHAQGIAGEDLPRVLLPSQLATLSSGGYAKSVVAERLGSRRQTGIGVAPWHGDDGLVSDWEHFDALVGHVLGARMQAAGGTHAVLFAEPNHNGRVARERLVELLFETHAVPAAYLARSAVLSAYANGRTTGIVLDVGHTGASAVPVLDGAVSKERLLRTSAGGRALGEALTTQLARRKIVLRPKWALDPHVPPPAEADAPKPAGDVAPSFYKHAVARLLDEVKESVCEVYDNPARPLAASHTVPEEYALPDGNLLDLGRDKYLAAEHILFGAMAHVQSTPSGDARASYVSQMRASGAAGGNAAGVPGGAGQPFSNGLSGLVIDVIRRCDPALHKDLYAGVCLTGGTTDMTGLFERVSTGLMHQYPRVRVLAASGSHERKYCAWTGGSILGTFSEFQKMWFSKSEYEENGTVFVHRKCP